MAMDTSASDTIPLDLKEPSGMKYEILPGYDYWAFMEQPQECDYKYHSETNRFVSYVFF